MEKIVLSTDIGYSYTKYAHNGVLSKFPSVIAKASSAGYIGESTSYEYGGKHYNVGNATDSHTVATRTDDFITKYSPLLLAHIFAKEDLKPDTICVSLSISEYKAKEKQLKEKVSKFIVNDELFQQEAVVFPQGMGIWILAGRPSDAVIIDIGYNTLDIFVVKNGSPNREHSTGFPGIGTCILANEVSGYIASRFDGIFIPELEANKYLQDKKIKILRKEFDLSEFIEDKKEDYTETIINSVLTIPQVKDMALKTDNFIIAGGGAYYIDHDVKNKHGIFIPDNPEYANVSGFLQLIGG